MTAATPASTPDPGGGVTKQLRGSSLLLAGRVLSMGLNFVTQVLIVRTLTKNDYGAFAYAIAVAAFAEPLITLGLHRGASRFLSIYDDREDHARLLGTLVLGVITILSLGLAVTLVTIGLGEVVGERLGADRQAIALLGILILLAPIDALDGLVESAFAVFARPMSIFVRKHVIAPSLRLGVVALLVLTERDARFLSVGYVVTGAAGVLFYGTYLVTLLRRRGLLGPRRGKVVVPVREVLGFTVSLLSADLVFLFISISSTVVLGSMAGVAAVASYQAVLAPARLNYRIVTSSFTLLFTPEAARLHARRDRQGLSELYWRTACWITVLSFPVFALTSAFAGPLTTLLYGSRYAGAAPLMAFLAFGYFVNAALGFNAHTLQITGNLATVVRINVAAVIVNVVLTVALVAGFGAVGAAAATAATFVVQNLLNQIGLRRRVGIEFLDRRAARIYGRVLVAVAVLAAFGAVVDAPVVADLAAAGLVSALLIRTSRRDLDVAGTFPELYRIPGLRPLLGAPPRAAVGAPTHDQEG